MTDSDPRRVDSILARFPGPVLLTPRPQKWALFIVCAAAFCALIWFVLLRTGGVSLYSMAGWLVVAILGVSVVAAIGNLVPGVAYLKLDAEGFEIKTLYGGKTFSWKTASHFRAEGSHVSRHIAFDVYTNEPPRSALFNFLIQRHRTVADNYGIAHDDLARLMNAWRAKAVGAARP